MESNPEYTAILTASKEFLDGRRDLRGLDVYNSWRLLLTGDEIHQMIRRVAKRLDELFEGKDIVLVSILKGCVFFYVDLVRYMTIPYSTYFIEASSYHNQQTQAETVELLSVLVPSKFENKTVVLVDELYDNGTTLNAVKEKLMQELSLPSERIFTCCLFRKSKVTSAPAPDMVGYDRLPDLWLVGYGLDDSQEKRGWTTLYAIPRAPGLPKNPDDLLFEETEDGRVAHLHARKALLQQLE